MYRFVMNKVKDLQELVFLTEGQLEDILGNDSNAKLLWNFLHSEPKVQDKSGPKIKARGKQ